MTKSADHKTLKIRDLRHNIFLQYTAVFAVYVLGIFAVLILSHCAFMQYHDAYKQGAFRLIELRNQLHSILTGEGFSFWSWYEGTGLDEPLENFVDPCSLIGSLFPYRYLELGFTVAALLRMYLGGLAFIVLGREVGLKKHQNLIGAILYVFSACFIGLALRQSEGLANAWLFPLLVTGAERIYKGKKPYLFIITVAYYMLATLYYAYMSAIGVLMYIVIRWFAYNDKFKIKQFAASMGRFILYGLTGIFITAFSSLFAAFTLMRSSTDSSLSYDGLFFGTKWYLAFGKMLLGTGTTVDYMDIGLPVLIIMLLPIAIRHISRKSTETIMTCVLFVMLMIPLFGSLFNGGGYSTTRWSYIFVLFATWCAAEQFDAERLREKDSLGLACAGLAVIGIWTMGFYLAGVIKTNETGKVFMTIQLLAGLVMIAVMVMIRNREKAGAIATAGVLAISLISLSAGWGVGFTNTIDKFARNAAVYKHLADSTLRVSGEIDDDDFYRIDSVDAISRHVEIKFPSNENIWWKTNNLPIYNSRIPETLTEFNVEMGNSYGYARRVFMVSNGNRPGLDFLLGVRYFLGTDKDKPETADSDNYAGYGFEKTDEIDGISVFRNKYDVGLGFVLDKAMLESEFDKLSRVEKEQALLQVAVVPDDEADKCEGVEFIKVSDLDLDIQDVPYEVVSTDGVSLEDGRLIADKDGASFTIAVKDVPDCQLMVSLDDFLRNSKDGETSASHEIRVQDSRVMKMAVNENSRQGVAGVKNHDFCMGSVSGDDEITVTLSKAGTYTFDRIYVSAMSNANYDEHAPECMGNRYKVTGYDEREVEGSVDTEDGGVLFLSIPAHDNWDIYVDGEKAEEIDDLDTTFFGAVVPAGSHEVTLRYDNRFVKTGAVFSIIGIIMLAVICYTERRRKSK